MRDRRRGSSSIVVLKSLVLGYCINTFVGITGVFAWFEIFFMYRFPCGMENVPQEPFGMFAYE